MAIFAVRVRAGETANWGALRRRVTIAGDPTQVRAGDPPTDLARMVALRGVRPIEFPEMIPISPKLSIMRDELTVGLFKQLMEGYAIEGHNADQLIALLADDSKAGEALTYVSLIDAREFAKRLSAQTGRKFRVQTEAEWLQAKDNLSGNYWTWTETKFDKSTFVLRHLFSADLDVSSPENRYSTGAVRLVEDK